MSPTPVGRDLFYLTDYGAIYMVPMSTMFITMFLWLRCGTLAVTRIACGLLAPRSRDISATQHLGFAAFRYRSRGVSVGLGMFDGSTDRMNGCMSGARGTDGSAC